jgi:hypothetical protein
MYVWILGEEGGEEVVGPERERREGREESN